MAKVQNPTQQELDQQAFECWFALEARRAQLRLQAYEQIQSGQARLLATIPGKPRHTDIYETLTKTQASLFLCTKTGIRFYKLNDQNLADKLRQANIRYIWCAELLRASERLAYLESMASQEAPNPISK